VQESHLVCKFSAFVGGVMVDTNGCLSRLKSSIRLDVLDTSASYDAVDMVNLLSLVWFNWGLCFAYGTVHYHSMKLR